MKISIPNREFQKIISKNKKPTNLDQFWVKKKKIAKITQRTSILHISMCVAARWLASDASC